MQWSPFYGGSVENENNGWFGPCPDCLAELGIHVGDLPEKVEDNETHSEKSIVSARAADNA